jgi:hypothetical protein
VSVFLLPYPLTDARLDNTHGQYRLAPVHDASQEPQLKSIAITGAGSGGLAMLKTLLDIPQSIRSTWTIVLYEHRENIGGVWYEAFIPISGFH